MYTWNPKQPFINGCFNWIIPNLYIGNGWKSPFPSMKINGWPWGSWVYQMLGHIFQGDIFCDIHGSRRFRMLVFSTLLATRLKTMASATRKSTTIGDGHTTFNRNPCNGYINPCGLGLMTINWKSTTILFGELL